MGDQKVFSCPKCGSANLSYQFIDTGTVGATTNRVVVVPAKKSKGCLYWIFIGWWAAPLYWIFIGWWKNLFFGGKARGGLNVSANKVLHKKMAICQNCGHSWPAK